MTSVDDDYGNYGLTSATTSGNDRVGRNEYGNDSELDEFNDTIDNVCHSFWFANCYLLMNTYAQSFATALD